MKQIKNPAYVKWAAELRKYSIEVGICEQIPIDDRCTRLRPYPTNYLTNPKYCDDDYHMSMLGVYIERFKASRSKSREQRYYECLEEDIKNKLSK